MKTLDILSFHRIATDKYKLRISIYILKFIAKRRYPVGDKQLNFLCFLRHTFQNYYDFSWGGEVIDFLVISHQLGWDLLPFKSEIDMVVTVTAQHSNPCMTSRKFTATDSLHRTVYPIKHAQFCRALFCFDYVIRNTQKLTPSTALKTKDHKFANFVITGGTVSCHYDNLRSHLWSQAIITIRPWSLIHISTIRAPMVEFQVRHRLVMYTSIMKHGMKLLIHTQTTEAWEWVCSFILHITGYVITYPCWDES